MNVKVTRRITSIFLALSMFVSCFAFNVFAADSPTKGQTVAADSLDTVVHESKRTVAAKAGRKITSVQYYNGSRKIKISKDGKKISNVPVGACMVLKVKDATTGKTTEDCRLQKKGKVTSAKNGKVKCQTYKKATSYKFEFTSKKGKKRIITSKKPSCKIPSGFEGGTVRSAPLITKKVKINGKKKTKTFIGALSDPKKIK